MENFILTISYLVIGMVLRKVPQFPKESASVLNLFVIYISLPALIFLKVPQLTISSDVLTPVLMPWGMLFVAAAIVFFTARAAGWSREITGSLLLMVPLGNTSFLGIPMVKAFFGEQGIPYAVFYDQFGSFIALATYGTVVLAIYGGGENLSFKRVGHRILTFPPFISLVLAMTVLNGVVFPAPVQTLVSTLASTLVPVVMIAVGFQFTLRLNKGVVMPLGFGILVKLVVSPLIALSACSLLGLDSLAARVSIFEAGMPPMVSAGALAVIAGMAPKLTAALVGVGIILSFVTLPLLFPLL